MLVGIPGSGKTTALRNATELLGWVPGPERDEPVPHVTYDSGAVQLGRNRAEMGGTDALSMSIGPAAIDFVLSEPADLLIAEGDRLAYSAFLDAAESVGTLDLVYLDAPPYVARQRSIGRNTTPQNVAWVKGRITKIDNLVARRAHIRLNASAPAHEVAAEVARLLARARPGPRPSAPAERL